MKKNHRFVELKLAKIVCTSVPIHEIRVMTVSADFSDIVLVTTMGILPLHYQGLGVFAL